MPQKARDSLTYSLAMAHVETTWCGSWLSKNLKREGSVLYACQGHFSGVFSITEADRHILEDCFPFGERSLSTSMVVAKRRLQMVRPREPRGRRPLQRGFLWALDGWRHQQVGQAEHLRRRGQRVQAREVRRGGEKRGLDHPLQKKLQAARQAAAL